MLVTEPTRAPISFRFSQSMLVRIALLISAWLLAACAVGPEYRVPEIKTGKGWSEPAESLMIDSELATWWRSLGDPMLDRLIEMALAQNLDIRQAQSRIAEERALRDSAVGARVPTLQADASANRRRQSLNGPLPIGTIPGLSRDQTIHDVGFDTTWEIDLFGRIRRMVESAEAQLQATEETASDIQISIVAEVARTYLTLRGTQRELVARSASVETLRRITDTVRRRAVEGDLAQSDVDRAQAQLDTVAAVLPNIRAHIRAAALGILISYMPQLGTIFHVQAHVLSY